ncbi:MAG: hypothetical protein Q4F41_19655 [Eubacteriales bacterium]|nr:hypothetical protein [Eubacteriales bacterium]
MNKRKEPNAGTASVFDDYDYLGKACSATDCTGLIPAGPVDKAQLEAYHALYPFDPPTEDCPQK